MAIKYKRDYLNFRGIGEQDRVLCDYCHKREGVDIHHINHNRKDNTMPNLCIMCRVCHSGHHDRNDPTTEQIIKALAK